MEQNSKIQMVVSECNFSAEGAQAWVTSEARYFLEMVKNIPPAALTTKAKPTREEGDRQNGNAPSITLRSFLDQCGATSNQNKKVIATALWHTARQGKQTFEIGELTSALHDAQQGRLANASQSLARVVKAGFAEKHPSGAYYITPEGKTHVGQKSDGEIV